MICNESPCTNDLAYYRSTWYAGFCSQESRPAELPAAAGVAAVATLPDAIACGVQASAARSQDQQSFQQQQALLQKKLAELRLKYDQFTAESSAANDALHKKRLKLQQEVEVCCLKKLHGTMQLRCMWCLQLLQNLEVCCLNSLMLWLACLDVMLCS